MKKYILSIFALGLASFCMSAQNDTTSTAAKDRLSEIENMSVEIRKHKSAKSRNDVFEINALSHIGYGRHKVDGDAFRSKFGQSRGRWLSCCGRRRARLCRSGTGGVRGPESIGICNVGPLKYMCYEKE